MLKSGVFGSLISALTSQGASSSMISSAVSALGSALNPVSSQVDSRLTQVASLCNNPAAYAAAAPALITQIEGISGLPPAIFNRPGLLEFCDVLGEGAAGTAALDAGRGAQGGAA